MSKARVAANLALPLGSAELTDTHTAFRPIHYLGSKLRLTEPILEAIDEVAKPEGMACDLFAGSGTMSLALAHTRDVLSVDIQEYSRVVCSSMLAPPRQRPDTAEMIERGFSAEPATKLIHAIEPIVAYEKKVCDLAAGGDPEPLCQFVEYASLLSFRDERIDGAAGKDLHRALTLAANRIAKAQLEDHPSSIVTRYFGGIYFSFAQAAELDALLDVAHSMPPASRDYCVAMVLSTASDIVNTVGKQFAQPIRPRDGNGNPKRHLTRQILRDRAASVRTIFSDWVGRYERLPAQRSEHKTVRSDYREFLSACSDKVGVVYADPPYTRDHYSRYYHVLETMCLRDNPAVSTMVLAGRELLSRGFYRKERHQSPFCIKTQAPGAFTELFAGVRRLNAPLVVSYSPYQADEGARPRLMTVEGIVQLAEKHFRRVEVRSVGRYAHNKFNQQDRNVRIFYDSEIMVICTP